MMVENVTDLEPLWRNLLLQLPVYLVWFAGLILAVVTWPRHPLVSLLAVLAVIILFTTSLSYAFLFQWSDQQLADDLWTDEELSHFDLLLDFCAAIMGMIAWILIFLAMFGFQVRRSNNVRPRDPTLFDPGLPPDVPEFPRKDG